MGNKQRIPLPTANSKYPLGAMVRLVKAVIGLTGMTGDDTIDVTWGADGSPIISAVPSQADRFINVKITAATPIPSTTNRWEYAGTEQIVNKNGVFMDKPGALPLPKIYNRFEWNNSASGKQGNGYDLTQMPAGSTFDTIPTNGTVVILCRRETNCDGVKELYCEYPNPITVNCPPPT